MGIYFFHIRDDFGLVEDPDGIELPDMAALLMEVVRSVNDLSREGTTHRRVRFEITDASGRIVLVVPVQASTASWVLLDHINGAEWPVQ